MLNVDPWGSTGLLSGTRPEDELLAFYTATPSIVPSGPLTVQSPHPWEGREHLDLPGSRVHLLVVVVVAGAPERPLPCCLQL